MAKIDLKPLSVTELKALQKRVEKAIERVESQKKTKALAELKAKAKQLGFSLAELTGGTAKAKPAAKAAKKKPAKRAAVYGDPSNKANTWSGRGARPQWLRAALESGKSLDSFKL